jgi:hypothetical protein
MEAHARHEPEGIAPGGKPIEERSTVELVQSIAQDGGLLVRKEIQLARQEILEAVLARAKAGAGFAIAGVFGLIGFLFALTAGAWGLGLVLPLWAAWLIVAGGLFLLAGGAALFARSRMHMPPMAPQETKRTVKEDVEWARAQLKP